MATQSKIYNSGKKLFSKYGPQLVSIDMIVEDAGVGKGTFYRYNKNKQELYENIIKDTLSFGKKYMIDLNKTNDSKERFFKFLIYSLRFFERNDIIREIVKENKNYYLGKINLDYLFATHFKIMKNLFGNEFNESQRLEIAKIKRIYIEIVNIKKNFKNEKEYKQFIIDFAAILTNGFYSDYKELSNKQKII